MNMMVKDVYQNFSAASEKVLVPKNMYCIG